MTNKRHFNSLEDDEPGVDFWCNVASLIAIVFTGVVLAAVVTLIVHLI